jgi:hypothetical protein
MKRVTVYWRNSPQEMELLSGVEHIRGGPDGEELLTTDEGAQAIRAIARDNEHALWVDALEEVDPHIAADLVCQWEPDREKRRALLRRLIEMVGREDSSAAESLTGELEDLLQA